MKKLLPKNIYLLTLLLPILLLATSLSTSAPLITYAAPANTYTLLEPLPCVPGNGITCTAGETKNNVNFKDYVQYAFNLIIALAAVAAVFMIVWGGLQYMSTDSFQGKKDGLARFRNAVLGLLLVLCSYLILKTIDPRLVAIPDTLVPQLILSSDLTRNNGSFNTNDAKLTQMSKDLGTDEAKLKDLNKQKADLTDQLNTLKAINFSTETPNEGDPAVQDLEAKIRKLDEGSGGIKDTQVNYDVKYAVFDMEHTVQTASSNNTPSFDNPTGTAQFDQAVSEIEQIKKDYTDRVVAEGGYDEQTAILERANYSELEIKLAKNDTLLNNTLIVSSILGRRAAIAEQSTQSIDSARSQFIDTLNSIAQDSAILNDATLSADIASRIQNSRKAVLSKFK